MRPPRFVMALLAVPALAVASDAARFSGGGTLVAGDAQSADGRFGVSAELVRSDRTQRGGQFSLDAQLAASAGAKSANAACANADALFKNSFED